MRYTKSEALGFPRSFFPVDLAGHEVHLLHNDAHETVDGRLQLHLTLHCPRCDSEKTVRGRLPPEIRDHTERAAAAKLIALGYFKEDCKNSGNRHTYYGP